ncbi:MAG: ATP phosphoribosyltransferase regulatory subunit [Caldilineales bacterium]
MTITDHHDHARWPLPQGVVDLFYEDAADKRQLEQALRSLFTSWSYDELIPPTFEYADTLASEAGTQIAEEMYRFTDRDGRTLALRPDLTVPTARVVGTRLYDQPMPLRLFYIGSVFRYERPQAGRQREFTQAGIELIGAGTPAADAEALALTVEALRLAGLQQFQVVLGQMAFFRGLLREIEASPDQIARLQSAIDRRNAGDLDAALDAVGAAGGLRRAFALLPDLHGGVEVIERARRVVMNDAMAGALGWLAAVHPWLASFGVAESISFDLGETRGMEYYTGITFKGYAAGMGFAVCSGGRYDDLVGHFGPPQPAVGCALWLDRILLARQRQTGRGGAAAATVLVAADGCPALAALSRAWRARGLRVELDLTVSTPDALRANAGQRRIPRIVRCRDAETVVLEDDRGVRDLSLDELAREAEQWT